MKKLIGAKSAGVILLISMILLAVFHALVMLKVLPSDIVWGGQINDPSVNIITLELIALAVTLVFSAVIILKLSYLKSGKSAVIINICLLIIFAYLIFNTIANIVSAVSVENFIFASVAFIQALLSLRLAIEK
jgi:hypothetical protein